MATKKLACEEAAEVLEAASVRVVMEPGVIKRLRDEGRELKRLRDIVCSDEKDINKWLTRVNREKARIQKARKK